LCILGEHHVMNALATITAARALGVPVDRSVPAIEALARAARWRMEVQPRRSTITHECLREDHVLRRDTRPRGCLQAQEHAHQHEVPPAATEDADRPTQSELEHVALGHGVPVAT